MITTTINIDDELVRTLMDMHINSKACRSRRRIGIIIMAVMGAFFLFVGLDDITKSFGAINLYYLILGTVSLLFGFVGLKWIQSKKYLKTVNKLMDQLNTRTRTYTFDENEIRIDLGYSSQIHNWQQMAEYGYAAHYLLIKKMDNQYIIIDKNTTPAKDMAQIEAWLKENHIPGMKF